jgi:hypothetical protein
VWQGSQPGIRFDSVAWLLGLYGSAVERRLGAERRVVGKDCRSTLQRGFLRLAGLAPYDTVCSKYRSRLTHNPKVPGPSGDRTLATELWRQNSDPTGLDSKDTRGPRVNVVIVPLVCSGSSSRLISNS